MPPTSPTLPTTRDLDQLFRQKYGDPQLVGWSPRQRHQYGYYLPEDHYEALMSHLVFPGCAWLDIGGGHQVFPVNPGLAETLVARCSTVVAVDPSDNVHKNTFVTHRVQACIEDYEDTPRFDLVTLRMVAEHIADPEALGRALQRTTKVGGLVVILTVNQWAPLTVVSRITPFGLHHPLKWAFWGTEEEDTFPVQYRMNTRPVLASLLRRSGFEEVLFTYLDDLSTWGRSRVMSAVEIAAWSLWRRTGLPYPENRLLGIYERRA